MLILSGTSNLPLSQKIVNTLGTNLALMDIIRFPDQEIYAEIQQTVRGEDIFIIQSTSPPANDYLMELLIIIDALKRGSAKRINCVMPYFGYARQDRKTSSRSPVSAKLVANLLVNAGADRIVGLDLHSLQIQGFFDIPVDHMLANVIFVQHIKENYPDLSDVVIVSPDVGGVTRARQVAKHLDCDIAIVDKRRLRAGVSEVMNIVGNVENKRCIIIDDIADSTGTLCNAAKALIESGKAKNVIAYCTHGVFSGNAQEKLNSSLLDKIICTDSIFHRDTSKLSHKVEYVTCSNLLASAIKRIATEQSTNSLFLK